MTDVEIVVRFFAFQNTKQISGGVRGMLDEVTKVNRHASEEDLDRFRREFVDALDTCVRVFGDDAFRLPPQGEQGKPRLSRPLFDAEMVAMHSLRDRREDILGNAQLVKEAVLGLADTQAETYDLMVGRANTAQSIKQRIEKVTEIIQRVIDGED